MVGPTGVGKTEVALQVARLIPAEIISVDSMQVYRGMDIGTGKPSPAIRGEIPHHGLDLVDPQEDFDVLRYASAVAPAIRAILERGKWALLVGGAGLYLRVLRRGLCDAPGQDPQRRDRLVEEALALGPGRLHERLRGVDAEAAQRIHPNDLRRTVRALEVFESSGRTLTQWQVDNRPCVVGLEHCPVVGLDCRREILYQRIDLRLEEWLNAGWLEEAGGLLQRGLSRTAREALGYRELFDYLEGRSDWEQTRLLMARNTRRYAKRQWSWFRHEPDVVWIDTRGRATKDLSQEIVERWMGSVGG